MCVKTWVGSVGDLSAQVLDVGDLACPVSQSITPVPPTYRRARRTATDGPPVNPTRCLFCLFTREADRSGLSSVFFPSSLVSWSRLVHVAIPFSPCGSVTDGEGREVPLRPSSVCINRACVYLRCWWGPFVPAYLILGSYSWLSRPFSKAPKSAQRPNGTEPRRSPHSCGDAAFLAESWAPAGLLPSDRCGMQLRGGM